MEMTNRGNRKFTGRFDGHALDMPGPTWPCLNSCQMLPGARKWHVNDEFTLDQAFHAAQLLSRLLSKYCDVNVALRINRANDAKLLQLKDQRNAASSFALHAPETTSRPSSSPQPSNPRRPMSFGYPRETSLLLPVF